MQLCLVSSSPSKVGQFSFKCCPLSQKSALGSTSFTALGVWPFGMLVCHSTPSLSLYASGDLCWVPLVPLALCPTPVLQGRFSIPPPPLMSVLDYSSLFMVFSFAGEGGSICPGGYAGLFFRGGVELGVGRGARHGV
jgi:hypothetical protein